MEAVILKVGKGLGFILPDELVLEGNIVAGAKYKVMSADGKIVLVPKKARVSYKLEDLLANINPSNIHGEISTGKDVGKECW
jgi:antitoxin MazE